MQMLSEDSSKQSRRPWRPWVVGLFVLGLLGAAAHAAPLDQWLAAFAVRVQSAGIAGPPLYLAAYVVGSLLLMPAALLTMVAGFAYGPVWGFLLALPSATVAGAVSFLVVRRFGRNWVVRRLRNYPRLAAVDQAIAVRGLRMVLLLRLSPILPFALLNYAMAVSRLRFSHFVLGSMIGKTPVTVLHVYLASAVTRLSELRLGRVDSGILGELVFWLGLLATALVTVQVTRLARAYTHASALEPVTAAKDVHERDA